MEIMPSTKWGDGWKSVAWWPYFAGRITHVSVRSSTLASDAIRARTLSARAIHDAYRFPMTATVFAPPWKDMPRWMAPDRGGAPLSRLRPREDLGLRRLCASA